MVGKLASIPHLKAILAFEKAGLRVIRRGEHVVMSDGVRIITIPRGNPINAFTLGQRDSRRGLSIEEFKKLL